jgi:hypothetical protein
MSFLNCCCSVEEQTKTEIKQIEIKKEISNNELEISKISSIDDILRLSTSNPNIFKELREDTFGDLKSNIILH